MSQRAPLESFTVTLSSEFIHRVKKNSQSFMSTRQKVLVGVAGGAAATYVAGRETSSHFMAGLLLKEGTHSIVLDAWGLHVGTGQRRAGQIGWHEIVAWSIDKRFAVLLSSSSGRTIALPLDQIPTSALAMLTETCERLPAAEQRKVAHFGPIPWRERSTSHKVITGSLLVALGIVLLLSIFLVVLVALHETGVAFQ